MQFRQGDVLIEKIESIPASAKKLPLDSGAAVLAHGEATGHRHAIYGRAVMFRDDGAGGVSYLRVAGKKSGAPVALKHEEHAPIELAPGDYRVTRQREYSPEEIRNVAD